MTLCYGGGPILSPDHIRARITNAPVRELDRGEATPFASVAVVLRYAAVEPEVLLIRRAEHPDDRWSGHMAFPGGRKDPTDADLVATAIRETHEEVGVELDAAAERIGRLDDVRAMSRAGPLDLLIVPHVFVLRDEVTLTPEAGEVAEALWAPMGPMFRGETKTRFPYEHAGNKILLPGFQVGPHVVWGLTHRMLEILFARLR